MNGDGRCMRYGGEGGASAEGVVLTAWGVGSADDVEREGSRSFGYGGLLRLSAGEGSLPSECVWSLSVSRGGTLDRRPCT